MEKTTDNSVGPPMVEIDGIRIKKIREEKGLTQLYVATVVGVTTDTVSRWENRKYPSIKRENGLKLAKALDVELEELMAETGIKSVEFPEEGPREPEKQARRKDIFFSARPITVVIIITLLLVVAAGLGILLFGTVQERKEPVNVSAVRILPKHAPAGAVFPVLIKVSMDDNGPYSLIVKEELPEGCRAMGGVPSYNMTDGSKRVLKWVSRVNGETHIAYLVRMGEDLGDEKLTGFKGEIVLGGEAATEVISGDDCVEFLPYHWVDGNSDNVIDDEEILAFYDRFSEVEGLDIKRELIDEIWASKGYEWDKKSGKYKILP